MAQFVPNQPVTQPDASVSVDVTPNSPLPMGVNRFQLVVVDDAGNESDPVILEVIVRDTEKPTAVLDMVDERGGRIDPVVSFGQTFVLSGARSSDIAPGKVAEYRFTLIDPR